MAQVTASMVKELREMTGLGMMECKKALAEANGDIKAAENLLRIKSGAKASKVAGRIAAEGAVGAYVSPGGKTAALVEVNCETDFVAKDTHFKDFVSTVAQCIAETNPATNEVLAETKLSSGETVEGARKALVMKLGENINVRRYARVQTAGHVSFYVHGNKIGVLVDYQGGDEVLGKNLAMHIAANKPLCVSKQQVPAEIIAKEREIYLAQAAESGKPANIIEKMVDGKIAKYLAEVTLLGQPFVRDPEQTVEKLLAARGARVNAFYLFVVGEGIKKKSGDFAAEVMAQVGRA
ncbi:MAG TPA: translation elongation factor Ts [Burkholderiales bacterium]|nr:translation elongation factor Ts [Burkholderiales bacterium]